MLECYFPDKSCMLALKLMSFREKDRPDVQALCQQLGIRTREQAQQVVDHYVERRWQKEYRLDLTLRDLF